MLHVAQNSDFTDVRLSILTGTGFDFAEMKFMIEYRMRMKSSIGERIS